MAAIKHSAKAIICMVALLVTGGLQAQSAGEAEKAQARQEVAIIAAEIPVLEAELARNQQLAQSPSLPASQRSVLAARQQQIASEVQTKRARLAALQAVVNH